MRALRVLGLGLRALRVWVLGWRLGSSGFWFRPLLTAFVSSGSTGRFSMPPTLLNPL